MTTTVRIRNEGPASIQVSIYQQPAHPIPEPTIVLVNEEVEMIVYARQSLFVQELPHELLDDVRVMDLHRPKEETVAEIEPAIAFEPPMKAGDVLHIEPASEPEPDPSVQAESVEDTPT